MDFISFIEKEFGEVRAVLASDSGDQSYLPFRYRQFFNAVGGGGLRSVGAGCHCNFDLEKWM